MRERGLKGQKYWNIWHLVRVAPVRERGLKGPMPLYGVPGLGRSREGAWIERSCQVVHCKSLKVAPVRERGLKGVRH